VSISIKPDSVIDQYLVAKTNVTKYAQDRVSPIGVFTPGQTVGKVFSYVTSPSFMWEFQDKNGKTYYTKHAPGFYETPKSAQVAIIKAEAEQEQIIKDEKGEFAYYASKYGIPVLATAVVLTVISALIRKDWNN
jgi:hypothetical protein